MQPKSSATARAETTTPKQPQDEALEDQPTGDLPAGEFAHGCYDGWVFIGYVVEDEQGEPVENVDCVPCRRCHG